MSICVCHEIWIFSPLIESGFPMYRISPGCGVHGPSSSRQSWRSRGSPQPPFGLPRRDIPGTVPLNWRLGGNNVDLCSSKNWRYSSVANTGSHFSFEPWKWTPLSKKKKEKKRKKKKNTQSKNVSFQYDWWLINCSKELPPPPPPFFFLENKVSPSFQTAKKPAISGRGLSMRHVQRKS